MMSETDNDMSGDETQTVNTDGKDATVNTASDDAPPPEPPWPPFDFDEWDFLTW
jgi:hypothetical protein